MGETIKLTLAQGNQYLAAALTFEFPDAVGSKKFGPHGRAKINEKFRQLGKCLKKVSVNKSGEGGWVFGLGIHEGGWKRLQLETQPPQVPDGKGGRIQLEIKRSEEMEDAETETLWTLKEPDLEVEVTLTPKAMSGAFWISYLWAKPDSNWHKNPGFLDEIVWPVVEAIGKEAELIKDLGLDDEEDEAVETGKVLEMPKKGEAPSSAAQ